MNSINARKSGFGWRLVAAVMAIAAFLSLYAPDSWSVVNCLSVSATDSRDSDGDGLTDFQECTGITTAGTSATPFPRCGVALSDGTLPLRNACLDPDAKDLFVIFAPAATGSSLIPADFQFFGSVSAYGLTFRGLSAFAITVHQITPAQAGPDREITAALTGLAAPKAVRVSESLDSNGTILGNCQWGTPSGLDGCIVYTRRTRDFITLKCGSLTIKTPAGQVTNLDDVFTAYMTYLVLHETGHSLGGLTTTYNSQYGGYHYAPAAGFLMDQAVTYTTKSNTCKWYISPGWNTTVEAPAVNLK